jgi:predicted nucleic acid-binding protein
MRLRIYLDVCCFNRPFDDCRQDRIRLESEAVKAIVQRIERGLWEGVSSPVILYEISKMSDKDRAIEVGLMVAKMRVAVKLTNVVHQRALAIEALGFSGVDALHLACAEFGKADVFLTTDDRLQKRAVRHQHNIKIEVDNPLRWFERMVQK